MNWSRKIFTDTSWLAFEKVISLALGILTQLIIVRELPKETYGLILYVLSVISALNFLSLGSLGTSITTSVSKKMYGNYSKSNQLVLGAGIIGSLILLGFSFVSYKIHSQPTLGTMLLIATFHGPFLWLDTHKALWSGQRKFRIQALVEIFRKTIQFISIFLIMRISTNPIPLLFGYLTMSCLVRIFYLVKNTRAIESHHLYEPNIDEEAFTYGWKTSLYGNVAVSISLQLHRLIIGFFHGPIVLASFGVAELFRTYVFDNGYSIYQNIVLPRLAALSTLEAFSTTKIHIYLLSTASILLSIFTGLLVKPVFFFLYGDKYIDSIEWAYYFIAIGALTAPIKPVLTFFKSRSFTKPTLICFWTGASGKLLLIPLMAFIFGKIGVVYGMMLAQFISSFVSVTLFMSINKAKYFDYQKS